MTPDIGRREVHTASKSQGDGCDCLRRSRPLALEAPACPPPLQASSPRGRSSGRSSHPWRQMCCGLQVNPLISDTPQLRSLYTFCWCEPTKSTVTSLPHRVPHNRFQLHPSGAEVLNSIYVSVQDDRLSGPVTRLPSCRPRGPGFDFRRCQIFSVAVGMERSPLSPCEDK
jgi:hypothetical protein